MKILFIYICGFVLAGCSLTLPVDGSLRRSADLFLGEATGYSDKTGILSVTTLSGKKCTGDFKYLTDKTGDGNFKCDDGRFGKFLFTSSGYNGNGFGKLNDGEEFVFRFGNPGAFKSID